MLEWLLVNVIISAEGRLLLRSLEENNNFSRIYPDIPRRIFSRRFREIVRPKNICRTKKKKLEKAGAELDGKSPVEYYCSLRFSVRERGLDKSCRLAEAFSPPGSEEKNFFRPGRGGVTVVKVIAGRRIMARLGRCTMLVDN